MSALPDWPGTMLAVSIFSRKLRNSADAAALLVQNFDYCGMARSFTYNTGDTTSVTMKSCALGYYSFGHEIAHNLGALHDPRVSTNGIFPEGHGHLIAQVRALVFTITKFLIYKC